MKKTIIDLRINEAIYADGSVLLKAVPAEGKLPETMPGQFVQLCSKTAFLRRPISIHDVEGEQISFLIQIVGEGTRWFQTLKAGDLLNAVMPLGRGFTPSEAGERVLLVGGGVGVAPLLYLGRVLKAKGVKPVFLLGARTGDALLRLDAFRAVGDVHVTTEDGSLGERGFVTDHSILTQEQFTLIQTCGPTPMMKAIGRYAQAHNIRCEVSLENRMACGIGACLCCVEDTVEGHKCVCTDGPVFDITDLKM